MRHDLLPLRLGNMNNVQSTCAGFFQGTRTSSDLLVALNAHVVQETGASLYLPRRRHEFDAQHGNGWVVISLLGSLAPNTLDTAPAT